MPHRPTCALALAVISATPAIAGAQERLELTEIPDLSVFDAVFPVDRDYLHRRGPRTGFAATLGAGASVHDEVGRAPTVTGGLALGLGCERALLALRSDLWGSAAEAEELELADLRGRHQLVAVAGWGERRRSGGRLVLDGSVSHSGRQGLRLQTAAFGSARQVVGQGSAEGAILFGDEVFDDDSLAFHVVVDGAAVRWLDDGPAERSTTAGLRMGISSILEMRESVRGRIDFVSARVGHTRVDPAPATPAIGEAGIGRLGEVRAISVRSGVDELTLYDREVLGTFTAHAGWSWLEADTLDRALRDNHFEFHLATNVKFAGKESINRLSLGVGRQPTHSADGQRIIADHRLEMSADHETSRLELGARGGLSWLTSLRGGAGSADETILRYGSQLEAFYKLGMGFQLGAYQAASFEPQGVLDPWAAPRTWNAEAGLLLRWKGASSHRTRPRYAHAYQPY